jgi:Uma2 family endonuclease
MSVIPLQRDVEYPESDGQPMAESDLHADVMIYLRLALREHFRNAPDVYVAGNLFFYFKQGDPRAVVAPDLFVVKGVPKEPRRKYLLWEEGQVPCFVVEVTSSSTQHDDLRSKKDCYERLGVEEYFLFDPLGDYLKPRLQGYRLANGRYEPVGPRTDGLHSRTAGVTLRVEGEHLRLVDTATGAPYLRPDELTLRQAKP